MNATHTDVSTKKMCPKCGQSKQLAEFGKNACRCKECERKRGMEKYFRTKEKCRIRAKNWRDTHKEQSRAISCKSQKLARIKCKALKDKIASQNPCIYCKESRIGCLDFHHINPKTKTKPVARCISEKDLLIEASKCIILCANCHRLLHTGDIQLPENITPLVYTPQ